MSASWVGQSVPRVDGSAKVTGAARYIDDIHVEGALFGATVRSEIARGRIKAIVRDPSFDWSGITFVTAEHIPGDNVVALIEDDQPLLAIGEIRHSYEPIALVACDDPVRLAHAVKAVRVDVEPLDPVLSIDDAIAKKHLIYGKDNIFKCFCIRHEIDDGADQGASAIEAVLAECPVLLRGRYSVHHQEQLYIEPQGMIAEWDERGVVHIMGSLQCPYYVHRTIKRAFGLDDALVDIAQTVTGGGFGGKEEYPSVIAAHCALLAKVAARPVRMIYGRKEDIEATTKRHPCVVEVSTGCTGAGDLVALKIDCLMDGGAYSTLSSVVLSRGILHAAGCYRWRHARVQGRVVATNTPPNGAFRGFGAPQTIWAIERHMDRLARLLGEEPLAFKRKRAVGIGSVTVTGQTLTESVGLDECVERASVASDYAAKRAQYDAQGGSGRVRRGIGAAVFMHGAGFNGSVERRLRGKVTVDLEAGGRLRIRAASTDIGQGTETVFRQIAADAAGVPMEAVVFEQPRTLNVPDSGPTVASRTVMVVGSIVGKAAKQVADRVAAWSKGAAAASASSFGQAADGLLQSEGRVSATVEHEPPLKNPWDDEAYRGDAYPCYAFGCDIAEVEVDLDTLETRVLKFWAAQDIGKAIHPVLCAGQVEGGTLQAIGWALYENVVRKEGRILNPRMTNYVIPTSKDSPPFKTILVEHPFSGGPSGAKGVGELPMDGGAPAIAAALEQALGVELNDLPLLPERLFAATRRHPA